MSQSPNPETPMQDNEEQELNTATDCWNVCMNDQKFNKVEGDEYTAFTDEIPQECMEKSELANNVDFTAENTHVAYLEDMMNERYREFNKALTDLAALVDTFSADKKTIKYIKDQYLQTYIKYFDVIKYIYGLDIGDDSIKPGTNADRVLFKREVVEPKRITLNNGKKLHIYVTKDGKYNFIDEVYSSGAGLSLNDIAFWIENREKFAENYVCVDNLPAQINIFGRTAYIPIKGLRIPRNGNIMADRFYAILGRLHKQIGDLLMERKKTLAKTGKTICSDDELMEDDDDN